MNDSQQLREQMWDLVYGLLEADESQSLITRIKSDPQAARLYAEVRLQADLVGYAAQVEDASVVLKPEDAAHPIASREGVVQPARKPVATSAAAKSAQVRGGTWLAGIAAAALAILIAVGLYWPRVDHQRLAEGLIVVGVETPRLLAAGITSDRIRLRTEGLDGVARAARLDVSVVDEAGQQVFGYQLDSNSLGLASLEVPGQAVVPGARLEVAAAPLLATKERTLAELDKTADVAEGVQEAQSDRFGQTPATATASLTAALPVHPEPTFWYLLTESPSVEPGESMRFSLWNLSAVTGTPVAAPIAGLAVENAEGLAVVEPMWEIDPDTGSVSGEAQLPESLDGYLALSIRPAGGDKVSLPLDGSRTLDRLAAQKSDVDSRLALSNAPLPSQLRRSAVEELKSKTLENEKLQRDQLASRKEAQTFAEKSLADSADSKKLTESDALAEVKDYFAVEDRRAANRVWSAQPPAELANKRALAVVKYNNLPVAMHTLEPVDVQSGSEVATTVGATSSQALSLPPEVDGSFDVLWFDRSADPPEFVAAETIEREPSRKLRLEMASGKWNWQPGQTVSLTFQVKDESGQPVPHSQLGVRVWNEQLAEVDGEEPVLLASQFGQRVELLGEEVISERAVAGGALAKNGLQFRRVDPVGGSPQFDKAEENRRGLALAPGETSPEELRESENAEKAAFGAAQAGSGEGGRVAGESDLAQLQQHRFFDATAADDFTTRDVTADLLQSLEMQVLATNRPAVEAEWEAAKVVAEAQRRASLATLGRVLLLGGIGAGLLLGLLFLFRLPARNRVLIPALAMVAASLLIGLNWVGWIPAERLRQIAQAPADFAKEPSATYETSLPQAATPPPARSMSGSPASKEPATNLYAVPLTDIESATFDLPTNAPTDDSASAPAERGALGLASGDSPAGPEVNDGVGRPRANGGFKGDSQSAPSAGGVSGRVQGDNAVPAGDAVPAGGRGGAVDGSAVEQAARDMARRPNEPASQSGNAGSTARMKRSVDDSPKQTPTPQAAGAASAPPVTPTAEPAEAAPLATPAAEKPLPGTPAPNAPPASPLSDLMEKKLDGEKDKLPRSAESGLNSSDRAKLGSRPDVAGKAARAEADVARSKSADKPAKASRFRMDELEAKTATEAAKELEEGVARNRGRGPAAAPASIYFQPHLLADENGLATIEFTLPAMESEYRLLIDAVGSGRVGSAEGLILGRHAPQE